MRSTFSGLNTMVLGIYSQQISQETVGHNMTNANTEGYSRQSVNLAAIKANYQSSLYGNLLVGAGVDSMSLTRARDIFADRQYWTEKSTSVYLETRQKQYQKIESVFNDTTQNDIENALEDFYSAWETLSVDASVTSPRISVIGKGQVLADYIHTAAQKLQQQINDNYTDMSLNVTKMNNLMTQIVQVNKKISLAESTGASANDLRDQRDLLTDELSEYANINIYENELGMYQIVSNGITLINGVHNLTLEMSKPIYNEVYGISDYVIRIKESGVTYQPLNGEMRGLQDAIAEDKDYIDHLANISAFMLKTLNDVHKQGLGIDSVPTGGLNFYGDNNTSYSWELANDTTPKGINGYYIKAERYDEHWTTNAPTRSDGLATFTMNGEPSETEYLQGINIIKELEINPILQEPDGEKLVAARMYTGVQQPVDVDGIVATPKITSSLLGGIVACGYGDFECTVSTDSGGNLVYTCNGVGGRAGDIYTLEYGNNATYGYVATFIDPDGNRTNHGLYNISDASGKKYYLSLDPGTNQMTFRDSDDNLYYLSGTNLVSVETDLPDEEEDYVINGTGDGSNAVRLATLFNTGNDNRSKYAPLGTQSINSYYNKAMTKLGSDAESTNMKIEAQEEVMLQIEEWRQSTSGVNWNEELTNMLKFQQGFSACSRCLTTMDEMLDRLINSTGMVGR